VRLFRRIFIAVNALRRNILRAVLTTLGIIIGVGAVIAMMEIGQGSSMAVQKSISSMGANNLIIFPGASASGGVSWGAGSSMTLTPYDCEAIQRECPAVLAAAPIVRGPRSQVVFGNRNWTPQNITGTTPDYLKVQNWEGLAEGEEFTEHDVRAANKVCLIGQTIARELFQGASPVGQDIRIQNVAVKVVGVLRLKGANMMGQDQDDIILAPWTAIKFRIAGAAGISAGSSSGGGSASVNTLNNLYPSGSTPLYPAPSASQQANTPLPIRFIVVDQILASAVSGEQTQPAQAQITALLRERHRTKRGAPEDFSIRDLAEIIKMMTQTQRLMINLLLVVATISLVVGGVGIMNIMLVSVTERTKEIGLRMAVGARSRDILIQFLTEAVILCLAGGALGIALGRSCSAIVTYFLHWPIAISMTAIIAAVAVSASVGIVFGFYPAWKASRLDPIEALRYE
jgi:ABC-type antimicrobial peptide transport system permease subunit